MKPPSWKRASLLLWLAITCNALAAQKRAVNERVDLVDAALKEHLQQLGFTGNVEATLEQRLGRAVDPTRANLGRLLWFDTITGLNNDNACAGRHSPARGFGDTQSIAIGIDNNGIVGPGRTLFGQAFPEVRQGAPITFDMFGQATAEFEFTLIFVDAPIDQFARGKKNALTTDQKKGALLFFGKAHCVECHAVSGPSNEMP